NWTEAERLYQLSIALNPNYPVVYEWYAWFLMTQGRFSEALLKIRQAQKLDPSSLTLHTVKGLPLYYERKYDEAAEQFNQPLGMDENFVQSYYYFGSALIQQKKYFEASQAFERVITRDYFQQGSALLIYALAKGGYREKALAHLGSLKTFAEQRYVSPYVMAIAHVGLGDLDTALNYLERAYEERASWIV